MAKNNRRLFPEEATQLGLDIKEPEPNRKGKARYYISDEDWELIKSNRGSESDVKIETKVNDYNEKKPFVLSAWGEDGRMMDIDKYCEYYNLPRNTISSHKLVTHTGVPYYNIAYGKVTNEEEIKEIDFESIIKKYISPFTVKPISHDLGSFSFDRLVYTDVHIGMTPNQNGYSLYGGKWDEQEIKSRLDVMISKVLLDKKSNVLIIDELGDFLDGWDAETVRKGHKLPQNMDNEKAFDVGLEFKIRLIDSLAPYYSKIICNNICNDNHAGSFGYTVNKASKTFLEYRYKHVKVFNHRTFIVHYVYGNNCFILTHGKDGKNLKFGFKPVLDAKQIEKIEGYIDHHDLHKYEIEFSKGDSHQKIFDESTSDKFNYFNYGAFSPSSEWVQTNFKKGKSFFEFFNYKNDGSKSVHPHVFKWNINRNEETVILSA